MHRQRRRAFLWTAAAVASAAALGPLNAQQASPVCRLSGRVSAAGSPLPGVAIVARGVNAASRATSSEVDGRFQLPLSPGVHKVRIELTGFAVSERDITMTEPCAEQTVDIQLVLAPRTPRPTTTAAAGRGRFETLNVQTDPAALAAEATQPPAREELDAVTRSLLPPGFSTDAPTESLAVAGNMASMDRGMLNDRLGAIGRGEFDPVTGEFAEGQGPGGAGGPGGRGAPGAGGRGRGGPGGPGGRGGGRGEFALAGRGGRQNAYNIQANYNYGGSALDSAPYQLRPDSQRDVNPYSRQTFGVTIGGPVRLPGYNGQRRTTFTLAYNGNRGDQLFDQYATVPSEAMRSGDLSSIPRPVIDPSTGQPFASNQIPADRMSAASTTLLRFIPLPNLDGTTRNFRYTTTTDTVNDNVNLRLTHNFSSAAGGRGAPGGRGGGRMGGPGGRGGRGGRGNQGTSVVLNAQLQYRRNDNEQNNVFPTLGGATTGSSISAPFSLNIMRRRTMHNLNVTVTRTESENLGRYAYIEDVAGNAGIEGVASDPATWGVPTLSFSSLTGVRDVTPNDRSDTRWTLAYTMTRPWRNTHTLRIGGDFRVDEANSINDPNARGAFTFTGLHTSGGSPSARGGGLDFADFLLGLPQQATVQYGPGLVSMAGRSMSLFIQDDWRKSAALTFNIGLRYELLWPFREQNGQMANLDVAPGFSAASPVLSGQAGPFTGDYPTSLLLADTNNIAPRAGFAWRAARGTIVRGGYGISYNAGSYSNIARQMVSQPPFAVTDTRLGTAADALSIERAFAGGAAGTTNNYGVDKDYDLGLVQTWNADLSRDVRQVWNVGAGYTYTRGASLDIVRAPNRGPDGLRIPGVQPFLWQSSKGSSVLHAIVLRGLRRPVRGVGGGFSYTWAKSRDNASTIGGGGTVVAQDDRNLAAEWGLSSFDRRHQFSGDLSVELPFGANRPWLNRGGPWAAILENWRASFSFAWQSGTPYTPRVQAAASDVARGTSGTLRANYSGDPIQISDPSIDLFFNTAAFTVPAAGSFGTASRNLIIGPGSRQLNAQFSRDIRLGGTRVLSVNLNATNLLNMVNYGAIDTVVNSPTFGQVTSVRPMRSMQLGLRFRF